MKNIPITAEMQSRIDAAAGAPVDPSTILVFECVAYTRDPIRKPGSLFDGGVAKPGMYSQMAAYVNSGNSVTLQLMHADELRPDGRVFYAAETPEGLRAQFYTPITNDVNPDINNGLLADVSVGMVAQKILCSQCGFDYRGADATILNLIEQTCNEGHTIGEDGTHVVLDGLDTWYELSLCGAGASPGAKILAPAAARLAARSKHLHQLAASSGAPEALILMTPPHPANPKGHSMDLAEFTTQLTAKVTEIADLTAKLTAATTAKTADDAKIVDLTAKLTAAEAAKTELTAKFTAAETTIARHTAVVAELTAARTYLKVQAKAAVIAAGGKADAVIPESIAELTALIDGSGLKIANLAAASQRPVASTVTLGAFTDTTVNGAFNTRK